MSAFSPAPTWAMPVIVDPTSGENTFNPIWLRWFLDLSITASKSFYGQLSISTPRAQVLDGTWSAVVNYETALLAPLGVTQTLVAGTLTLGTVGTCVVSAAGSLSFTATAGVGYFEVRLVNTTDSVVVGSPVRFSVDAGSTGANFQFSTLLEPGLKAYRIDLGNGSTFVAAQLLTLSYGIYAV